MNKRTTEISILIMGAFAFLLISPPENSAQKPKTPTTEKKMPSPVVMASVTLPPPPAFKSVASKSITPLVSNRIETDQVMTKLIKPSQRPEPAPAPAPAPIALTPVMPMTKPARRAALPDQIKPAPRPKQKQIVKSAARQKSTAEKKNQGRPLLKLLEFGKGPSIEIAWPNGSTERARLYDLFHQCYGMRVALMSSSGRLFDDQSPSGQAWALNTDRFSGFVRQSQGRAASAETSQINSIRSRHGLRSGNTVRLFPRETDALLLGGLQNLIGDTYLNSKTIRATYQISGWRVQVSGIHAGDNPIAGTVDLSGAVKTRCKI